MKIGQNLGDGVKRRDGNEAVFIERVEQVGKEGLRRRSGRSRYRRQVGFREARSRYNPYCSGSRYGRRVCNQIIASLTLNFA